MTLRCADNCAAYSTAQSALLREKMLNGGLRDELSLSCVCCVAVQPGDRLLAVGGEDEPDRRVRPRPDPVRLERQGLRDAPARPDRVDAAEVQIKRCLFLLSAFSIVLILSLAMGSILGKPPKMSIIDASIILFPLGILVGTEVMHTKS